METRLVDVSETRGVCCGNEDAFLHMSLVLLTGLLIRVEQGADTFSRMSIKYVNLPQRIISHPDNPRAGEF